MNLSNTPVVLVTGSAKRIGAVIIEKAHVQGFNVIVHYNHSENQAKALVNKLNTIRENSAKLVQADLEIVNDETLLHGFVKEVMSCFGQLNAIVHNASVFHPTDILHTSYQDLCQSWDSLFLTNAKVPLLLTQAFLAHLQKNNAQLTLENKQVFTNNIVSIIDIHADTPFVGYPIYNMAKAAHKMMVKSLALELAPSIRVNGVSPGTNIFPEDTQISSSSNSHTIKPNQQQDILASIPLKKAGMPDDIADTVLFLLKSNYITGEVIAVDGGRRLTIKGG